jgi:hypothetical protein
VGLRLNRIDRGAHRRYGLLPGLACWRRDGGGPLHSG